MSTASLAKADLEALLRDRKLDATLTTALPETAWDDRAMVPTGVPVLDHRLGGGFPRGQLSELAGPRSSGRMSLLLASLAGATCRGEAVALVDPLDMFDPASAAQAGVALERLLWIRGTQASPVVVQAWFTDQRGRRGGDSDGGIEWQLDRAVKAMNLVLEARGFGLVALDLGEVPPVVVKRLPFTTWLRLQRAVEGRDTACVLVAGEPVARSAGGITLVLTPPADRARPVSRFVVAPPAPCGRWAGSGRRSRWLRGLETDVRIVRAARRGGDEAPCRVVVGA